jgi:AraC family transcriptional regulator of adaptative response / methylphosphotriester-DNA alkyltransferase methyltransferase
MTEEEWNAILNRDKNYDGVFYYGLKTSNKIKRPSCPSKHPKPENVEIFYSLEDAYAKGYTPCKNCCPDDPCWTGAKNEIVLSAKKIIEEQYLEKFSLKKIADSLYVNESYLLRIFKQITGNTPLEYHNKMRCQKSIEYLLNPNYNLAYISSMVGYISSSHYIRCFRKYYNCTPTQYRKERFEHESSPLSQSDSPCSSS